MFTCAYCALEGVSGTSSPEDDNLQCSVFCSCFEDVIVLSHISRDKQTERFLYSGLCNCQITNRSICILTVSADSFFRKDKLTLTINGPPTDLLFVFHPFLKKFLFFPVFSATSRMIHNAPWVFCA